MDIELDTGTAEMRHDGQARDHSLPPRLTSPAEMNLSIRASPAMFDLSVEAPKTAAGAEEDEHAEGIARTLADPWSEPASRRAIGFLARRRVRQNGLAGVRIDPIPFGGEGHDLEWLCFGPQDEVDVWRATARYARESLSSVERWLKGDFLTYGGAIAARFDLPLLLETVLADWSERDADVIRSRISGMTLEQIANQYTLTRERVRQIEISASNHAADRLTALKARRHPLAVGIERHLITLATRVLHTASKREVILRPGDRGRWIAEVLPPADAEAFRRLLAMARVADENWPFDDPFDGVGHVFQDGLTLSPWRDEHVVRLKTAFASVASEQRNRACLIALEVSSGFNRDDIEMLCPFAGFIRVAGHVFDGRPTAHDIRRAQVAEVLSRAGRAMHIAEIMEALPEDQPDMGQSPLNLRLAMTDAPDLFVGDGRALWQLRSQLGGLIDDVRPDHPDVPPAPSGERLLSAINLLALSGWTTRPEPLLAGVDPLASDFAIGAGECLARALSRLPSNERRSISQILHQDDEPLLVRWIRSDGPVEIPKEGKGSSHPHRVLAGLTLFAAMVAVVRADKDSDSGYWPVVHDACGAGKRDWIFTAQAALGSRAMASLVEVARCFNLRRAYSFRSDVWVSLLDLQTGLSRKDLGRFPVLLSESQPPVALRQLVAPGANYSAVMACTWHALRGFRNGTVDRAVVETVAKHSDWWPGWSIDEACRFAAERRSRSPDRPAEMTEEAQPHPSSSAESWDASAGESNDDLQSQIARLPVFLDRDGRAFSVPLPNRLSVSPGPVTLVCDKCRVGGMVGVQGATRWHAEETRLRLPLRGGAARIFRLERADEILTASPVRFWQSDAWLLAFPLGSEHGGAFDPLMVALPRTGGVALMIHRALILSRPADTEKALDADYTLHLFADGTPHGMTVSCEGEIVWEAESPCEPAIDADLIAVLDIDAAVIKWGGIANLVMREDFPDFEPLRVRVGAHSLRAERDGDCWCFPGFQILPGAETLRRRGRMDGVLRGERVSIPAQISLVRAPIGAALHDPIGWRPLTPDAVFNNASDGRARLWACLPNNADTDWTLFEGPRPVMAYRGNGIRPGTNLYGLGEPLTIEPRFYHRDDHGVALAGTVTDTGLIDGADASDHATIVRLSTPISWSPRHRAIGLSPTGITELQPRDAYDPSIDLRFDAEVVNQTALLLFHEDAWLGTWMFAASGPHAVRSLFSKADDLASVLRLSIRGHLPVLASEVMSDLVVQGRLAKGQEFAVLSDLPAGGAAGHAIRELSRSWMPRRNVAETFLNDVLQADTRSVRKGTTLDRLASDAPLAAARVILSGIAGLPRTEKETVAIKLTMRWLRGKDVHVGLTESPRVAARRAEQTLLEAALAWTRLDSNFLASRREGALGTLAWSQVTAQVPGAGDANLGTALTVAPVRAWLMIHLMNRIFDQSL